MNDRSHLRVRITGGKDPPSHSIFRHDTGKCECVSQMAFTIDGKKARLSRVCIVFMVVSPRKRPLGSFRGVQKDGINFVVDASRGGSASFQDELVSSLDNSPL